MISKNRLDFSGDPDHVTLGSGLQCGVAADSASWLFLSLLNFCILKCTWPLLTLAEVCTVWMVDISTTDGHQRKV